MDLHVFNSFSNETVATLPLEEGPVAIGRGPDNTIRLESPFIAPRHAVVFLRDGAAWIDSATAVNPVKVGGVDVVKGDPVRVRPSDEVQLAEYILYLTEPEAEAEAVEDPARARRNDPSLRALAFEESIHDKILSALQLQTVNTAERKNAEYMARIDRALLEIIRSRLGEIDAAVGDHFIAAYLRRRLAADIAAAGERRGRKGQQADAPSKAVRDAFDRTFRTPAGDLLEVTLGRVVADLARRMNLNLSRLRPGQKLTRDRVLDDMHAMDTAFAEALPAALAELPPGGREHMIACTVGKDLHDILFGYGPLEDLLRMPDVEEIMVLNENQIYVGKEGRVEATGRRFFSRKVVLSVIERIVGEVGRKIDFREPLVDARLADGSRVNAVIPPVAVSGPTLTIRRFPESRYTMDDLVHLGTLTAAVGHFLRACVQGKKNVLVSGGTGTGKTTLLNVLAGFIGRDERIVTIEDAAELALPQRHVVTLEARPPGLEGTGAVSIDQLLRNALRMRPDRIIVGECRGAEAVEMLQAMNTGHDGSLTTVHANDTREALQRVETMVLKAGLDLPSRAIREQISSAIHVICQITRRPDGRRSVTRVSEVAGIDPATGEIILQDVFAWQEEAPARVGAAAPKELETSARPASAGRLAHTGYIPAFSDALFGRGLLKVEDLLNA
jgi:pilus assembly protein CpaF